MTCNIVVEDQVAIDLTRYVLKAAGLHEQVRIFRAGGRSAGVSLVRTLLVARDAPVAVILDADSTVPADVEQRRSRTQEAIREVGDLSRTLLVLAEPEIEAWFFPTALAASRVLARPVTEAELVGLQQRPHDGLRTMQPPDVGRASSLLRIPEALRRLGPDDLLSQPDMRRIVTFVRNSTGETAPQLASNIGSA